MAPRMACLAFVGFFLAVTRGTLADQGPVTLPVKVSVENDLFNMAPESYSSSVVEGGVLLGALRRLQEAQHDFKFTVKEDPDFGLLLESVNGVAGNEREQTYWEILSDHSGKFIRLNVGIGCYTPKANEHILLRLSTWPRERRAN